MARQRNGSWRWLGRIVSLLGITSLASLMVPSPVYAVMPPEEPMDCEVYETKRFGVTIGFRIGNMVLNAGPDLTFTTEQGVAWDRVSQGLIARYVELCTRYNAGLVDKQEYHQRLQEIEQLQIEAEKLQARLMEKVKARKDATRQRMEDLLRDKSGIRKSTEQQDQESDNLVESVEQLSLRIERLSSVTAPVQGTPP